MAGLCPNFQNRRHTPTGKSAVRNAGLRPAAASAHRCRLRGQVAAARHFVSHFVSRAPKKNAPPEGPRTPIPTVSCTGPAEARLPPQSASPAGLPCTADFLVGKSWQSSVPSPETDETRRLENQRYGTRVCNQARPPPQTQREHHSSIHKAQPTSALPHNIGHAADPIIYCKK